MDGQMILWNGLITDEGGMFKNRSTWKQRAGVCSLKFPLHKHSRRSVNW